MFNNSFKSVISFLICNCLILWFVHPAKALNKHIQLFLNNRIGHLQKNFGLSKNQYALLVDTNKQRMYLSKGTTIIKTYKISTAKNGLGALNNSNKTPPGIHKVKEKIGTHLPRGAILKARKFTGLISKIYSDKTDLKKDLITSRILWLQGLESGINSGGNFDSYQRFIYIHGTPEEGLLGQPASEGCIRMANQEIIELYQLVNSGTLVDIF